MKEIFCTIGPTSLNGNFLKNIKKLGVTLVRINLSHTSLKDLPKIIHKIRKYTKISICIDTEGAQIRTSNCKRKFLKVNQLIKLDNNKKSKNLSLYPNIINVIKKNSILDIGFENLKIKIVNKSDNFLLGKVISSGWKPIRNIHGDIEREYMIVVEFPSEKIFQEFLDEAEKENIHPLREQSTKNYIWTLYEHWNIREWVS